jgi:DNA (cytosine-5)-methyltransferase 1
MVATTHARFNVAAAIASGNMVAARPTGETDTGIRVSWQDTKPLMLDLFCKAGGCTRGFQSAGFRVVGCDIEPQKRYIGDDFVQMDAVELLRRLVAGDSIKARSGKQYRLCDFAFIHASPPCQPHTQLNNIKKIARSTSANYVDLIAPTRDLLIASGLPYTIENVEGARDMLRDPIMICGTFFPALRVYRHRLIESNIALEVPDHVPHDDDMPAAGRGPSSKGYVTVGGNGGINNLPAGWTPKAYKSMAMGIDWMSLRELGEAVPPLYLEMVGRQVMAHITLQPPQAPTSPVPPAPLHLAFASAENAKWWLEHLAALMAEPVQGCATPPKSPKPPNLAVVKPAPVLVPMVLNREWLDVWRKVHAPTEESAFVSRIEAERNRVKLTALMRDLSMGRTPEPFILPAIELERAA